MTSITLPKSLEQQLAQRAKSQHRTIEAVVLDLLHDALRDPALPTLETVVASIQNAPPNPATIVPSRGLLAEVLQRTSDEPFDQAAWEAEWRLIELEFKDIHQKRVTPNFG